MRRVSHGQVWGAIALNCVVAVADPDEMRGAMKAISMQPPGIFENDNVITGSLALTPTLPVTISFVAQANWPSSAGTTITNRACVARPASCYLCVCGRTRRATPYPGPIPLSCRW